MSEKIVEYIELSSAALEKAAADRAQEKKARDAALAKIAAAVEVLAGNGLIKQSQRELATSTLSTHAGAIDLLETLGRRSILKKADAAPAPLGAPRPAEKAASATSVRASDNSFVAGMLAIGK